MGFTFKVNPFIIEFAGFDHTDCIHNKRGYFYNFFYYVYGFVAVLEQAFWPWMLHGFLTCLKRRGNDC